MLKAPRQNKQQTKYKESYVWADMTAGQPWMITRLTQDKLKLKSKKYEINLASQDNNRFTSDLFF